MAVAVSVANATSSSIGDTVKITLGSGHAAVTDALYVGDSGQIDDEVLRKLDKRIVGLVAFLYLLSFLDRSSKSQLVEPRC